MSNWFNNTENSSDIILTSRIRLARNIDNMPFPSRMTPEMKIELNKKVKDAILSSNTPFAKNLKFIDMNNVPDTEVYAMVERHIISPEFAQKRVDKAIIISDDESICVMIGEEDHIRIQVLKSGFSLEEAYDIAERLDKLLCDTLHFAFNENLGFLTECPTNLGTGLLASVMLHLPALEANGEISYISDYVSKLGFTVRGIYGEGSGSKAGLYQLSNQITLGISEKDAINNLSGITKQIIEKENNARELFRNIKSEDSIYRALGILENARLISTEEMMNCISLIKLGISLGILNIDSSLPNKIFIECQPNMLMSKYGIMDAEDRDKQRADYIRQLLE